MLNLQAYIQSGNLEQYCLGLLNAEQVKEVCHLSEVYPEISKKLTHIELALEQMALSQAISPSPKLRDRLFATLDFADTALDINNLPPTSKFSDYKKWLKAVEHLIPSEPFDDFFAEVLKQDEHIAQTLVITKLNVPEEVHEVVAESFFILKGTCTCTVGNQSIL